MSLPTILEDGTIRSDRGSAERILARIPIERDIAILVIALGVTIAIALVSLKVTVDNVLARSSVDAALDSARLVTAGVADLDQIAAGGPPSASSMSLLEAAQRSGRAFRYEIFDREGRARLVAEGGIAHGGSSAIVADAVRALASNEPVVGVRNGMRPGEPVFFATAFVPVSIGGRSAAVVGASVDRTELRDQFRRVFDVAALLLLVLSGAAFGIPALAWRRRAEEKRMADDRARELAANARAQQSRLEGMLANTPHGLCMFDADKCLVLCNERYVELYNLSPEVVRPGTPLKTIVDYRHKVGTGPVNFPNYVTHADVEWRPDGNSVFEVALEDGRTIRLNHLALAGGGYVATHEDMTEVELEASKARAARELAESRAVLAAELERKNKELESFSYSVSHDLRTPLRAIDGFSHAILEDCGDQLNEVGRNHLNRIRAAANRMGELIDDILDLSRVTRAEMTLARVDLSAIAREVVEDLRRSGEDRAIEFRIDDGLVVEADRRMMAIVLENLIGNAWKFTRRTEHPVIEFGLRHEGQPALFVRDNGAGFNMEHAGKLFRPFQRLHTEAEFPGTGIGLATIQRVIDRHAGRVWAEGAVGRGATFFFTLPTRDAGAVGGHRDR